MADSPSPYPETPELPLPDMSDKSEILIDDQRRLICQHLPARAEGYSWKLLYSTSKHGFSLHSLYREMGKVESPVLMVIQDTTGSIFGALTSCPLKTSDLFYGTGESFLFTFDPDFARFPWTGDNMYFIKGNQDSLVIGAGDGNFGLWLDEDLCHGRSQSCKTFANPRLSKEEDFVVKALECWGFVWRGDYHDLPLLVTKITH